MEKSDRDSQWVQVTLTRGTRSVGCSYERRLSSPNLNDEGNGDERDSNHVEGIVDEKLEETLLKQLTGQIKELEEQWDFSTRDEILKAMVKSSIVLS